jgi:phosphate:Na+ symporter
VIRIVLGAGLRGSALQLVRFEDFFCLVGGVLMLLLFYAERYGHVPLVGALAQQISPELSLQLAVVFLLSNLLPALLLWPLFGVVERGLSRLWPLGKEEEDAVPKFLHPQAHADPATALDLVLREEARLLRHAGRHLECLRQRPEAKGMSNEDIHRAFASLAQGIAEFNAGLARNPAAVTTAERLKLAQEELALIGDLEEVAGELPQTVPRMVSALSGCVGHLVESLADTWDLAVRAADALREDDIVKLREVTHQHGPFLEEVRGQCSKPEIQAAPATLADVLDLSGTAERLAWILHRLAKVLAETSAHRAAPAGPSR